MKKRSHARSFAEALHTLSRSFRILRFASEVPSLQGQAVAAGLRASPFLSVRSLSSLLYARDLHHSEAVQALRAIEALL